MIKKFNRIAMAMLVAAMPVAFASCSDDENNDEPQPEAVRVVATYNAQIHLSMLDYLDVMVDYPGPDGQVVTDTLGSAEWERRRCVRGCPHRRILSFEPVSRSLPERTQPGDPFTHKRPKIRRLPCENHMACGILSRVLYRQAAFLRATRINCEQCIQNV